MGNCTMSWARRAAALIVLLCVLILHVPSLSAAPLQLASTANNTYQVNITSTKTVLQEKRCAYDDYKCTTNCTTKLWPVGDCHNDGGTDFLDQLRELTERSFHRQFYKTSDGSCSTADGAP